MLLKDRRIFIIEDNVTNRSVMQLIVEQNGGKVGFERWGRDAESRLADFFPVDLILLDLMFPDKITGYDIFDKIRANDQFKDIPIVAVTASEPETEMPKTRQKGFSGFLCKPIKFALFPKQVAALINGEQIWETG